MKSRKNASMVEVFTSIYAGPEVIGHNIKLHVLDNECYRAVQNFLKIKNIARQNAEAHHHNANAAELAVKSTKYHHLTPRHQGRKFPHLTLEQNDHTNSGHVEHVMHLEKQ